MPPVWTVASSSSQLLTVRRDGDGKLLSSSGLALSLPTAPDPPLLTGGFVVLQQNVFWLGQVPARRLVVYRESELTATRRRIGK